MSDRTLRARLTRRRRWLECLAVLALVCSVGTGSASAVPITVTSLGNAGPGTLRAALETAPSGSTIVVPAGTITLAPPALPVTQSVNVVGAGVGATTVSGAGVTGVIAITGTPTVTLEGLTITGGMAQFGGGIRSSGGTLTLKDVEMTGNHTPPGGAGFGGAIFVGPGALNIIDSTLSHNVAGGEGFAGFGGAILYGEEKGPTGFTLSIVRSTFANNRAGGGGKGAGFGGAILADTSTAGAALSLSALDSTFSGNTAGGGGSEANGFGGAVEFDSSFEGVTTTFIVERSTIAGNSAGGAQGSGLGGGIEYDVDSAASATGRIVDTTVAGNTAGGGIGGAGFGGGIEGEGPLSLSFDTIAGNAAGGGGGTAFGGGVQLEETTPVTGTVLAENAGGNCFVEAGKAPLLSLGHNLADDTTCAIAGPGDKQGVPAGLGPLAFDGGPTQTMPPLPGSALIDAGPGGGCPATDQRGVARPQGAACDIGAVELAPPSVTTGPPRGLTSTSETLSGSASNPAPLGGTVSFQYGTSTKYGSQTKLQTLAAGTGPGTFTAVVSGLAPHTLYHYRAIASNPDGTAVGADATFMTPGVSLPAPPVLSHLSQTHAAWRLGHGFARLSRRAPKGTVFSFELNEAATVRLRIVSLRTGRLVKHKCVALKHSNIHRHACTRELKAGVLTLAGHAGRDRVSFAGLFAGASPLSPGGYVLEATAYDVFGQASATKRLRFRVVR